jgi:hypothetical protein
VSGDRIQDIDAALAEAEIRERQPADRSRIREMAERMAEERRAKARLAARQPAPRSVEIASKEQAARIGAARNASRLSAAGIAGDPGVGGELNRSEPVSAKRRSITMAAGLKRAPRRRRGRSGGPRPAGKTVTILRALPVAGETPIGYGELCARLPEIATTSIAAYLTSFAKRGWVDRTGESKQFRYTLGAKGALYLKTFHPPG